MKKIFTTLFSILIATSISFSQKQANIWYFGNNAGLDFSSGSPVPVVKSDWASPGQSFGNTEEGHATISDENGVFLFYTNGKTIWDKNAAIMNNGGGLMGDLSSTQCATIFPLGTSKTKFVVLTTPVTSDNTSGVRYNVVDLDPTTNGGYATGNVTIKNQIMPPSLNVNVTEALASCPVSGSPSHRWVIAHSKAEGAAATGTFYAWRVSANSSGNIVITNPVTSNIGNIAGPSGGANAISVMKFNNCFNRIALTNYADKFLQVFSFDNATGVVSNFSAAVGVLKLDVSATSGASTGDISRNYGIEFSPSGKYLYMTQSGEDPSGIVGDGDIRKQRLYRYDLAPNATPTAAQIQATRLSMFEQDMTDDAGNNFRRLGHLQLGPDKKIYMTHMQDGYNLSVITAPDAVSPGFSSKSISFPGGALTSMGLPSFDKGLLAASVSVVGSDSTGTSITNLGEICSGISTKFTPTYTGTASSYTWDMNLPAGTAPNGGTSAAGVATHKYSTGNYKIVVVVVDAVCGYTVRDTSTIKVSQVTQATGYSKCVTPNIKLIVSNASSAANKYVWYTDAAGKKPVYTGTPVTIAQTGAPGSVYSGNYYVKQVDDFTVGTYVATPAVASIPGGTSSISTGPTGISSYTATTSGAQAITTLNVTRALTLNSFDFAVRADGGSGSGGAVSYTYTIKRGATVVVAPTVVSGSTVGYGGTVGVSSISYAIDGNGRRVFTVNTGALALSVGTHTIEIYVSSASSSFTDIIRFSSTLTNPSNSGNITNNGSGSSTTYAYNMNVTTTTIPGTPAVMKDTITSTSTACAQTSVVVPVSCALPIEWVSFSANKNAAGALLNWVTAKEENNDRFEIQRSVDGVNFTSIGTIKGAGTKKSSSYYEYTDNYKTNGVVYYRIKQIDIDGSASFTDVRSVNYGTDDAFSFAIYPSPNKGNFTVKINNPVADEINIILMDLTGHTVWSQKFATESNFERQINLEGILTKGVYFIKAGTSTQKIIIE